MNYNQMHIKLCKFNTVVYDKFTEQLANIDPAASLCYQSQYDKFTISLYNSNCVGTLNTIKVETEHLILISDFQVTPAIEQLAQELTKFIMNGPEE